MWCGVVLCGVVRAWCGVVCGVGCDKGLWWAECGRGSRVCGRCGQSVVVASVVWSLVWSRG